MRDWDGQKFDSRLKEILAQRNLTQGEAAEKSGVKTAIISQWKKAEHNNTPRIDDIGNLADALECNTDWLAFGFGPRDRTDEALFAGIRGRPYVAQLLKELANLPIGQPAEQRDDLPPELCALLLSKKERREVLGALQAFAASPESGLAADGAVVRITRLLMTLDESQKKSDPKAGRDKKAETPQSDQSGVGVEQSQPSRPKS